MKTKEPPVPVRLGRFSPILFVVPTSELIAKSYLNLFGSIKDVRTATELGAGLTKGVASNTTIAAPESVAVKGIREIRFEGQHICFIECEAFDEGEVLTEIARTSYVAKGFGEVPKGVAIRLNNTWRIGIEKGSTIKEVVCSTCGERAVIIRRASATTHKRVVGRVVGSEQRLARNQAQTGIGGSERVRLAERKGDERYTFLVTLNTTDLPAAKYLIYDSTVVQKFLSLANWQFVEIAEDEHMRDILIAQRLFRLQVVRILRQKGIGAAKRGEPGIRAIRIR